MAGIERKCSARIKRQEVTRSVFFFLMWFFFFFFYLFVGLFILPSELGFSYVCLTTEQLRGKTYAHNYTAVEDIAAKQ